MVVVGGEGGAEEEGRLGWISIEGSVLIEVGSVMLVVLFQVVSQRFRFHRSVVVVMYSTVLVSSFMVSNRLSQFRP